MTQYEAKQGKKLRGLKLALALLVLPVAYVAVSHPRSVAAGQVAAPAGNQIADLEAAARTAPTAANRVNLAMAYINSGASPRAMPVLLSLVAEDKNNTIAWNDLCVANTLEKNYDAAIEDCNTAIRIEPNYTLARNNLKWAQDEKRASLQKDAPPAAVTHDANFYLNDGLSQLKLGLYDQAIDSWQHELALDPASAVAMNNIGTAYMMKKRTDEAIVWFDKAIAADPAMQLAKNNLAWANSEKAKR